MWFGRFGEYALTRFRDIRKMTRKRVQEILKDFRMVEYREILRAKLVITFRYMKSKYIYNVVRNYL